MHLYIIQSDITGAIKVGRANDPYKRVKQLQTGAAHELKIIKIFKNEGAKEKQIHKLLTSHGQHLTGEWFNWDCLRYFPDGMLSDFCWENEYWWKKT